MESDSGSAWVKQYDGCGDEWSAVVLLLEQCVYESAAERAAQGFYSLSQGVRGDVHDWW